MIKSPITFTVGEETLAGLILHNGNQEHLANFVFLHGAGLGTKELICNIAQPIIEQGNSILTIDFSGHGTSSGELKKSSLKKRVEEAQQAIDYYAVKQSLTVCGSSMGGYIAIKMLERYSIDTLILFCPALYTRDAYTIQFDQGFTQIIRAHASWRNTDVLKTLESFTGKLLIIIGQNDEVIPPEVIRLLDEHTPNTSRKEIYTIPYCPHSINIWINDHPKDLLELQQKILAYLY